MIHIHTQASSNLKALVRDELARGCGHLRPSRIVIKPNWVIHETDPAFPISALVTDSRVIEATVEACLALFPDVKLITVGDCPLQSADWQKIREQSGLNPIIEHFARTAGERVAFRDLRRDVYERRTGNFMEKSEAPSGDPRGYAEVSLDTRSHLEPISGDAVAFGVNDYSAATTTSNHRASIHRYLVCRTVLEADLFINLPKWKTHQKAGITGALKNLVGVNADKAYLPHFRRGAPRWGGDEYPDEKRWLYWLQTNVREAVQKRSAFAYRALKPGWEILKKLGGVQTTVKDPRSAVTGHVYAAGGAWPGNDTLWRMIYDLNAIIQMADREGIVRETPQRSYFCLVDGLVCCEGNGPLQALPKPVDWLIAGGDPFAIDTVLSWFMGFPPEHIPSIAQRRTYRGATWGTFSLDQLSVIFDGEEVRLTQSAVNLGFFPPPNWRQCLAR